VNEPGRPEFGRLEAAALKELLLQFRNSYVEYHSSYKVLDTYIKELELWAGPLWQT
jgi:hypothetical protein